MNSSPSEKGGEKRLTVHVVQNVPLEGEATAQVPEFLARVAEQLELEPGEMTVLLAPDDEIRALNRRYRGKDRTTDVLSFPGETLPDGSVHHGDLAISVPRAGRQAAQRHHSLLTELKYLLIHGTLHLMGYDHETDSGEMEAEERRLRDRLLTPEELGKKDCEATR